MSQKVNVEKMEQFVQFMNEKIVPIIAKDPEHFKNIVAARRKEVAERKARREKVLTYEQKIGICEICNKKDTIVEASGYHVAFVCATCL